MKKRNFSTGKLGESINALIKAAGVNKSEMRKCVHMSRVYFYRTLNCQQTI